MCFKAFTGGVTNPNQRKKLQIYTYKNLISNSTSTRFSPSI